MHLLTSLFTVLALLLQVEPQRYPVDGGPIYYETDFSRTIVEPFNFMSALVFFLVVLYWAWKLRRKYRQHVLLSIILLLLGIGALGGSVYHGFRIHRVWIMMDFMPILINLVLGSVFFWYQTTRRWWLSILAVVLFVAVSLTLFRYLPVPRSLAINLNYSLLGLMLLIPLTLTLWRDRWHNGHLVLGGLLLFGCAVYFRWADQLQPPLLPMGTHFLWHLCGVAATACIMQYMYKYVGHRDARETRRALRERVVRRNVAV